MAICPECNSGLISESFDEYHCSGCGYDWSKGDYEAIDEDLFGDDDDFGFDKTDKELFGDDDLDDIF